MNNVEKILFREDGNSTIGLGHLYRLFSLVEIYRKRKKYEFIFFNLKTILEKKKVWTNNCGIIEIEELLTQDIGNETGWKLAELKYQLAFEN